MELAPHTIANREFFAKGRAPHKAEWLDWIRRGVVRGKEIDGKPYVDLNWFAVNDVMQPPPTTPKRSGLDLLT
ncbi:MAG: hypothetical protein CMK70_13365 [Pseudohongiella sp.]|nr:hypothetical protein [Pseudohongiella sp.]